MSKRPDRAARGMQGFLMRLLRDVRGNTLVIVGLALIPLAGMVGGGLDISRMYILKTRLQHACDAGALAGRRAMGGGTWSYNSYYPRGEAERFFDANFEDGSYGSSDLDREFTESAGKVTGNASAKIPMTLMKIFGEGVKTLDVTCDAEMRLPNTDVMFVLDITGSMGDPQPGDSVSKIQALKTAVKCFYEIVARLDTDANCTTGTPSGGTGEQVQIRFGFVPYATNVNVGKLLPTNWFADSWEYQTRLPRWWIRQSQSSTSTPYATTVSRSSDCTKSKMSSSNSTVVMPYRTDIGIQADSANYAAGTCSGTRTTTTTVYKWREGGSASADDIFIEWHYGKLPINVSLLKNGASWNNSFQWPIEDYGQAKTIAWDGCVEERQTVRETDYDPVPSGARDLDIDSAPTGDVATQWGPVLRDAIFTRRNGSGNWSMPDQATTTDHPNQSIYACRTEARKLQQWPNAGDFDDYVDSLSASGNTYHDIGLIWGGRLISPDGMFKAENEFTPKGGEIERHMIFMTDGDACTATENYTAYGVAWFDRRQTNVAAVPTDGCTYNSATLTEQVNKRTESLCKVIKNKNVTLWVIAFGNLATETETRLKDCASTGRYFKATNAAALQQTFKQIADQISMLRLTS